MLTPLPTPLPNALPKAPPDPARRRLVAAVAFVSAAFAFLLMDFSGPPLAIPSAAAKTDRSGTYELARARMLSRVVGHIRAHYVEPQRIVPREMLRAAMKRVESEVPEIRVEVLLPDRPLRRGPPPLPRALAVTVLGTTREFTLEKVRDLYELNWKFMEIFAFIETAMPPAGDLESIEYAAISGMLETLDPHSAMLSPRQWREMQLSQRGRFGGLGIVVGSVDGALVIQDVMADTPAAEANLVPDDRIVRIGDASTLNMSLDEAVSLLRGEPGSEVTLWILRPPDTESRPVVLRRREIVVSSVEAEPLGDGIGWVHVRNFQDQTDQDLIAAVEKLERAPGGLRGLVLDLRDNPGGLLDKAIAVSDLFLDRGTIVSTVRESGRERDESHASARDTRADLPLVVLVNRGSASASEIVAGALKHNDRAVILGQRSFGKGSVQVVYRIDDAALKLTVAQYRTPGDISIQTVGIVPDVAVAPIRIPTERSFFGLDLQPPPDDAGGELALASHLASEHTRDERPAVTLRVLDDTRGPSHRRGGGDSFVPDATVELARDMLKAAPMAGRRAMLAALGGYFDGRDREMGLAIGKALTAFDIDWSDGPVPPRLALKAELAVAAGPRSARIDPTPTGVAPRLKAGEDAELTLRLTNQGPQSLHRLHAEIEASNGVFRGLELAFGRLDAGRSAERSVRFRIPAALVPGADRLTARLYSDATRLDPVAVIDVEVVGAPMPRFAHSLQVRDVARPGIGDTTDGGNGDGLVQRGERFQLEVWVDNLGPGHADGTVATLRNMAGNDVVLHVGRAELGALKPGERTPALFELTVNAAFRSRFVDLQLEIDDGRTRTHHEGLRVALSLPVFPDGLPPLEAASGLVVCERGEVRIHAGAHADSTVIATAGPGVIVDLVGRAGRWLKVAMSDRTLVREGLRRTGWVAASDVRTASDGAPALSGLTWLLDNEPPDLVVDAASLFVDTPTLTLRGQVRFAGTERRMVYAFRGRDKVFFRAFGEPNADDTHTPLPFDVAIPLEVGRNDIVVIAREGADRVTRRALTVYRRDAPARTPR
jgi:carboxyl-terminal processing protease